MQPGNIIFGEHGPHVIDFGISRITGDATVTAAGSALGTPGYLAPEQLQRARADMAGDVFALGAVLVFAATGGGPYGSGPGSTLLVRAMREEPRLDGMRAALPGSELPDLAAACLARDPAARPGAEEVLARISTAMGAVCEAGWLPRDLARVIAADRVDAESSLAIALPETSATDGGDKADRPDNPVVIGTPSPRRNGFPASRRLPRRLLFRGAAAAAAAAITYVAYRAETLPFQRADDTTTATPSAPTPWPAPVVWSRTPSEGTPVVTVAGDALYVGWPGWFERIQPTDGGRMWGVATGGTAGPPADDGDSVYFRDMGSIVVVDRASGTERTRWDHNAEDVAGAPALWRDHLWLMTRRGTLTAYATADGRALATREFPAAAEQPIGSDARPPQVFGDTLYVPYAGLHALDPMDASTRWTFGSAPSGVVAATAEGAYYVVRNTLYALTPDGSERWDKGGSPQERRRPISRSC